MRRRFRQVAVLASVLAAGFLVGLGCSESARQRGPKAEAPKPAESKAPESKAPESKPAESKPGKPKRVGSVIGLRPEKKEEYIRLHAAVWPGVLDRIRKSNIRNYSIYLAELEGKLYLFSQFEYVGDDFAADMKAMAGDPETQRWWKETDPCQNRLPGTPEGQQWLQIPEVFHTD